MKGLSSFQNFDCKKFFAGKIFGFVKATPWIQEGEELGSKVTTQIVEDKTKYPQADIDNFGELLVVKVRGVAPAAFSEWAPFETEVVITDVEKAVVYGEYRNQLSIIATVAIKGAH